MMLQVTISQYFNHLNLYYTEEWILEALYTVSYLHISMLHSYNHKTSLNIKGHTTIISFFIYFISKNWRSMDRQ